MLVLVTGGAGYLGSLACAELLARGHEVRVLDNVLHARVDVVDALLRDGIDVRVGDVRDATARRGALDGIDAVVHLAAIVGDPACAADPIASQAVNVDASLDLARDVARAGVGAFVFASTCSNYGVVEPGVVVSETGELNPVSAYARQKVAVERALLDGGAAADATVTCLRFSTLYGASPRMRFDLLVNEFVRDCWLDRTVEVYGGDTWRPYVHVSDAAATIATIVEQRAHAMPARVYNVGADADNFRKDELADLIAERVGRGTIAHVETGPDPRTYRVGFARLHAELDIGFAWDVPRGIDDLIEHLDVEAFGDLADRRFVNA